MKVDLNLDIKSVYIYIYIYIYTGRDSTGNFGNARRGRFCCAAVKIDVPASRTVVPRNPIDVMPRGGEFVDLRYRCILIRCMYKS